MAFLFLESLRIKNCSESLSAAVRTQTLNERIDIYKDCAFTKSVKTISNLSNSKTPIKQSIYIYIYIYISIYIHLYTYIHIHTHTHIYIHTYIHSHIHITTHIKTHTYTHI